MTRKKLSTNEKPKSITSQKLTTAIDVQTNSQPATHCSQIIPFYDNSFSKHKNSFQSFFPNDDDSLDLETFQQQQSQDPVLRTVYSWLNRNEKPEFLTPSITGTPFLHAYYKRFSQFFTEDSTNIISLFTTNTLPPDAHPISLPNIIRSTIRKCLPFQMLRTVFNKLHEHSHTGIKVTHNTFSQYYYIPYLEKWLPFLSKIALNVNVKNTSI